VCLSNLEEEGFEPGALSVIMRTPAEARAIAQVSGPCQALAPDALAERLRSLGMTADNAERFRLGAQTGVVIVVSTDDAADAAQETLTDHGATLVQTLAT
jgi:hypothetical protein